MDGLSLMAISKGTGIKWSNNSKDPQPVQPVEKIPEKDYEDSNNHPRNNIPSSSSIQFEFMKKAPPNPQNKVEEVKEESSLSEKEMDVQARHENNEDDKDDGDGEESDNSYSIDTPSFSPISYFYVLLMLGICIFVFNSIISSISLININSSIGTSSIFYPTFQMMVQGMFPVLVISIIVFTIFSGVISPLLRHGGDF